MLTELGRYVYADPFPEISPPSRGSTSPKIKAVKTSKQFSSRLAKFENCGDASRLQHAKNFEQPALIIRQVAESEGAGNQVEAPVAKRKRQRVRLDKRNARAACRGLGTRAHEHFRNEIGAHNFSADRRFLAKRQRQVARAAAQIEHARRGIVQDRA